MKGRVLKYPHPTNDAEAAELYWETAQTCTTRRHGPGCELGVRCQNYKFKGEGDLLERWNNVHVCVCINTILK